MNERKSQGWLRFVEQTPKAKTRVWLVVGGSGAIGTVHWGAQWRKYVFSPDPCTYYDNACLEEIAEFLSDRTFEHRHPEMRAVPA